MKPLMRALAVCGLVLLSGCASNRPTVFLHPEYDFSGVERIAVVPFENLSSEQGAGGYITRVFISELLASGAFDIVESGEVARVLATLGQVRTAELDLMGMKKMGEELKVQSVIFGSIGESGQSRGTSGSSHTVSLTARMVDCETGTTVWNSSLTTGGPGALSRMMGIGEVSRGEAVRTAVKRLVKSLVK